ncbi:MAG: thiamine phosphate synthase [Alphaproteobacteria bacterium]|jgi:thiamine-phosphate pyrophosphorylase|nr:thiamine phosphate synthase [Alphaproteobacteria bacterium]
MVYNFMMLTQKHENTESYLNFIEQCLQLGVNCVQFREKNITQESLDFLLNLKKLLQSYNVSLIINDNIHLAKEINASGVHLGQSDDGVEVARRVLGNNKIIGLSIEEESQIAVANKLPVNYVGCSAVFPSKSKNNIKKFWGLNGLADMCRESVHPVIAIGGINENNVYDVMQQGAAGVAVISALHDSYNLKETVSKIKGGLWKN